VYTSTFGGPPAMQQYTLCENQPSACTNAYHTPSSSSSLTNDMSGEVQNLSQQQSGEADEQSLLDEIVREGETLTLNFNTGSFALHLEAQRTGPPFSYSPDLPLCFGGGG
jgi:hypothetical protein